MESPTGSRIYPAWLDSSGSLASFSLTGARLNGPSHSTPWPANTPASPIPAGMRMWSGGRWTGWPRGCPLQLQQIHRPYATQPWICWANRNRRSPDNPCPITASPQNLPRRPHTGLIRAVDSGPVMGMGSLASEVEILGIGYFVGARRVVPTKYPIPNIFLIWPSPPSTYQRRQWTGRRV